MEKKLIIIFIILLLIAFLFGLFISKLNIANITGKAVLENEQYTYTKAICRENKCIDVLIYCENNQVKKIEPVSELVEIENFSDFRNNSDKLC